MGAKAVCPKHEVAHPRDEHCPYCEPDLLDVEADADTAVRVIEQVLVSDERMCSAPPPAD